MRRQTLTILAQIADRLDQVGLARLANRLDNIIAQVAEPEVAPPAEAPIEELAPPAPMPEMPLEPTAPPVPKSEYKTIFLQYERLQSFLDHVLPQLTYFGPKNIEYLKNVLVDVRKAIEPLSSLGSSYDKEAVDRYTTHIRELRAKLEEQLKKSISKQRVIRDRYSVLAELEHFAKHVDRLVGDDPQSGSIMAALHTAINVFENIIRSTAEEIAEVDLTKEL